MASIINTALCSFGMSGRVFHAPFIAAHPHFKLYAVWERSKAVVQDFYKDVKSYSSLDDMLQDPAIDLVIVNTPNYTHYEYAKKALLAGKHVIVEKPFTVVAGEARELIALAKQQNKKLSVYHNRRWDSDFKTVQNILLENVLGQVVDAEIHFDRYNPALSPKKHKELSGPGTGVLHDLGSHLIDAALQLFGKPEALFADLRILRPQSEVTDYMDVLLYYPNLRVHLKSSYYVKEPLAAFIIHGMEGSFLKSRADVQETHLQEGKSLASTDWGTEPATAAGILHFVKNGEATKTNIPTAKGNYMDYYDGIYKSIVQDGPLPVTAMEALQVMEIIDAALLSNEQQKVVSLSLL